MIHIISHTHWDREWYLTYEQFRLRLVGLIDRLLDLMEQHPEFEFFHLDGQTIVLEDYLELRPQQEGRLRALIQNGRILIGPWYDMPDEFLVSGEALIRNFARGRRLARQFGTPMPVGYLPDLFGHVGQMPQILRHFDLDNAILWRGFGGRQAEYWWEGVDGSRVLMMHLPPEGYCNATRVHLNRDEMLARATRAATAEAARTAVGEVLLMNGVDHVEPHPVIPELVRQLADAMKQPVRHSTLPRYVAAVRAAVAAGAGDGLEVIRGELRAGEDYANLLPGVFSARVYLKQANVRVQTLLERRAEPLAAFAWLRGHRYPHHELDYAWKTLLQNHPHDSICGCSIDPVHEENMTRFARAQQVGEAVADDAATLIARAVPGGAPGVMRLVAFNTTGVPYSGTIEATVDLPFADAEPRRPDPDALDAPVTLWPEAAQIAGITTSDGTPVPWQSDPPAPVTTFVMSRYETPWALRAHSHRLLFVGAVPALGYATFDVATRADGAAVSRDASAPLLVGDRSADNGRLRLTVNDDGTVDVEDLASGIRYRRCAELEDVADAGDEYNYSPPPNDRRLTSADAADVHVTVVEDGPVRVRFAVDLVLHLPSALTPDRAARTAETVPVAVRLDVALDAGAPRVHFTIGVDNRARDHRLRVLFPVGADRITDVRAETAFGVATRAPRRERPAAVRVEVPASYGPTATFTEAGSDEGSAIVYGEGLMEYEAYTDDVPRLGLTLLRAVGFLSRDDLAMRPSGHAGPGLATPGAQCLGRHEFRLAFEPARRRPAPSALFAGAAAFAVPPRVIPAGGGRDALPLQHRFLRLESIEGAAVLSACYRSEHRDALLVRLFNPDATTARTRLGLANGIATACPVDGCGTSGEGLPIAAGGVEVALRPAEILTLELQPAAFGQ